MKSIKEDLSTINKPSMYLRTEDVFDFLERLRLLRFHGLLKDLTYYKMRDLLTYKEANYEINKNRS
jgi:hypothetical protein